MRDHYDFSNAFKNPHAARRKHGYTIIVEHKDYDEIIDIKKSRVPKGQWATITEGEEYENFNEG
jgi:hypothetical protein